MNKLFLLFIISSFFYSTVQSQNIGINTTGATPAATNLLEVLSPSTTDASIGIYSLHSGVVAGTGYGIWAQKTGASTNNVAGYFSATGATNNYAIIVPSGGGRVGIGTTAPLTPLSVIATNNVESPAIPKVISTGDPTEPTKTISMGYDVTSDVGVIASVHATTGWKSTVINPVSGNVGVGTFAPEAKLEVQASEGNDATFALDADDGDETGDTWFIKAKASDNHLSFSNHTTEFFKMNGPRLYVMNSGNGVYLGENAGAADDLTANNNTLIGYNAGTAITTGSENVALGKDALSTNQTGVWSTAIGTEALKKSTSGPNVAVGWQAMKEATSAQLSTAVGFTALQSVQTSSGNTAIGYAALQLATGQNNTALGVRAADSLTSGTYNIIIGAREIDPPSNTASNQLTIGNLIYGTNLTGNSTIVSTGSIGIGTNAPASKLQVAGPIRTGIPSGGLGGAAATDGSIIFNNSTNTNTTTISTGVTSTSYSMVLPTAQGSANTTLVNDGSGNLSWSSTTGSAFGVAFTQTNSVTISNTTTETTIWGSGSGSSTIPANALTVGKTIRLTIMGYSRYTNGTMTIKIKMGGTTVLTSNAIPEWAVSSRSTGFTIMALITCRTTGASGTVIGQGNYICVSPSGSLTDSDAARGDFVSTTTTTIDTTTSNAVDVTATFSAAHASNTITVTNVIVELLN